MKDFEVILFSPTSSQPRYHKRANQIDKFCDLSIFYFERKYYRQNFFNFEGPVFSLGDIEDGKYLKRIYKFLRAVFKIRSVIKNKKNVFFYAMSFDCMLIAKFSGIENGFYEVGDLRQAEGFGRFFSFLERMYIKKLSGLILTSKYFYKDFYKNIGISDDRVFVIDNKLNVEFKGKRPQFFSKYNSENRIRIGLVGLLRYKKPIEFLIEFAKKYQEKYVIECFGDGPLRYLIEDSVCENINYYGSFKNPDDLQKIYTNIDLNFVVYDSASKNVRLAIPNKLFESIFFGVPILCCAGTALGKMVIDMGVGKTISLLSFENFEDSINGIDFEWIDSISNNCFHVNEDHLIDDGEKIIESMLNNVMLFRG